MKPETRRIIYIIIAIVIVVGIVLGITLGVVLNKDEEKQDTSIDEVEPEIINSYNNTDELLEKYPLENNVTIRPGIERNILNRLLTGFENWNRGFKAWKAWGKILYTEDSIYNVNGVRLSLAHYQNAMDVALKQVNIVLGVFHNIVVNDNYTAIYYDSTQVKGDYINPGTVMEFVLFKDYGEPLGTRVVEGWGGTKGSNYDSMAAFQDDKEKEIQLEQLNYMLNYDIPETTNLTEKYKLEHPTNYIDENADDILKIVYEQFDAWNQDEDLANYTEWVRNNYDSNATIVILQQNKTLEEYLTYSMARAQNKTITKLYFDNILIRDNWAALHYRYRTYDKITKEKYAGDRMQFLKFEQVDDRLIIVGSWIQ